MRVKYRHIIWAAWAFLQRSGQEVGVARGVTYETIVNSLCSLVSSIRNKINIFIPKLVCRKLYTSLVDVDFGQTQL